MPALAVWDTGSHGHSMERRSGDSVKPRSKKMLWIPAGNLSMVAMVLVGRIGHSAY
jgi:hypothetical protein